MSPRESPALKHVLALFLILALALAALVPAPAAAGEVEDGGVQAFLDAQPGPLKRYQEDGRSAAAIVEGAALYYGLSPRLHLALLEATAGLISDPSPPDEALLRPFGPAGPSGFGAQVDWASRELRAGLGPYTRPPTIRFSDGVTITLTLDQAPEGVAVQRFLARGRDSVEWRAAVEAFGKAFERYFANQIVQVGPGIGSGEPEAAPQPAGEGFLLQPWPAGVRVVHLAYFDHVYPTVDSGDDGNGYVVNYLGQGNVQYDGHDGHDYYFPDQPVGTPILAAADGVAYARTHRGYGVVIAHPGGYETVYWHLDGFAPLFDGLIDSGRGVPVRAGAFLGTSGATGFVRGTPHLHFEVRRFGRQIDPYGWQGPGADPCAAYAACLPGAWLWSPALGGTYDFTQPGTLPPLPSDGASAAQSGQPDGLTAAGGSAADDAASFTPPASSVDTAPPVGTLAVQPPAGLLFAAAFDGHAVQSVGRGFPTFYGRPRFAEGRSGEGLVLGAAGLTYPVAGNLKPAAGTISLWAALPEHYPAGRIPRHYLFAASASPDGAPVYSGTLALRRDAAGPGGPPAWTFWTTADGEATRDLLSAPDSFGPGWHHFAVTWDAETGEKALYLDGVRAAAAGGVTLPAAFGDVLQLGRFTYGGGPIGAVLDDLAVYGRALTPGEIAALAAAPPATAVAPQVLTSRTVRLDTNAIDDQGGIVAVQLGLDGVFEDPQPYYDSYRWVLPAVPGRHELAVRYGDRAGNTATVTQTVELDLRTRSYLPLVRR
jgi:murein DD-endopeptidase MepM/ murein hydrolase activator NlpD